MPLNPMRSVAGAASMTLYLTAIANGLSLRELELLLCNMDEKPWVRTEAMSASPSIT